MQTIEQKAYNYAKKTNLEGDEVLEVYEAYKNGYYEGEQRAILPVAVIYSVIGLLFGFIICFAIYGKI